MRIVLALSWTILYLEFLPFSVFAVEGVSDAKKIAEDMAKQHASALRVAYNGGLPGGVTTNKHTEFWDRVIQKLHSLNDGFGYIGHIKSDGKLNVRLADLLCYIPDTQHRPSQGNPTGNTEEFFQVDFIGGGPDKHLRWSHGSMEERRRLKDNEGKVGRCVFPRPGAPNYGYVPNHPGPVVGSGGGSGGTGSGNGNGNGNSNGNTDPNAIKGECGRWQGPSDQSCNQGRYHRHPGHTNSEYRWTCRDIPHAGETGCSESKTGGGGGNEEAQCPSPFPHYKKVGGSCLPSCGVSKNIYCAKNDCSGLVIASGPPCTNAGNRKAMDLKTYPSPKQSPCCLLRLNDGSR